MILVLLLVLGDGMTIHRDLPNRNHTSDVIQVEPFTEAVVSWNARGDIRVELRARTNGEWTPWYVMGECKGGKLNSAKHPDVAIDTLKLKKKADAFQYRYTVGTGAHVALIAVTHYTPGEKAKPKCDHKAWGKVLDVPQRSQMVEDPKIRGLICSPTSVSMVLEYYGIKRKTTDVCEGVLDHTANIYGNWPCNTAFAYTAGASEAYVKRCMSLCEVEEEIAAGRPVVLSHQWKKGELTDAPISESDGHLIVVVGFTQNGDVVVNDPAARERVRRTYKRAEIEKTWLENASGITYIIKK